MKAFAALYQRLDRSTATLDKRAALVDYFRQAGAHDAAWALYLLSGGKVGGARRKIAASGELRAGLPRNRAAAWLVEDSYAQVGDLAETLTLLLDDPAQPAADRRCPTGSNSTCWRWPTSPKRYAVRRSSPAGGSCAAANAWCSTSC
jgi:DNA ligase-1